MPKPKQHDPAERMLNLLALLGNNSQPQTLEQIMDQMGAEYGSSDEGRRTSFERDKASLREMGVPISNIVLRGDAAGKTAYFLNKKGYGTLASQLTVDEIKALQEAAAMVQIDTEWGRRAVVRLGGVIDDHVGFGTMHLESGSLALPELWRATNECRVVSMRYNAKDRTVHPYGLLSRDGYWYLGAYDLTRQEEVVFRVDRIQGDVVIGATPQAFVRRADYKLADAMPADAKLFDGADEQAVVRIDKVLALTVARELGQSGVILTHDNGDIDVRVSCVNRVAFRAWLFAMVDRAEVLSPPNVRQEVIGWLNEVATGI